PLPRPCGSAVRRAHPRDRSRTPRPGAAERRRRARASVRRRRRSRAQRTWAGQNRCRTRGTRGQRRTRARGAWARRSLFGFVLRIVVVLGVDGEWFLSDLGLFEHFLGGGSSLLGLLRLFLDLLPTVAEERAADARSLLRLCRAVVARERDAARVLGAREDLAGGHAGVRGVAAHDRSDVRSAGTHRIA